MIPGWFSAPHLSRPDLRRRARSLWAVSWSFLAVVTAVLAIAVLVEPGTLARRATTIALVAVLVLALHAISRSGRPLHASWMLVIGLTVIVTQRAWITGGIHAPVAVFYALFIVMAASLVGARGALVTAGLAILGAIVLTIGTMLGLLATRPGAGSPLGAFVFAILAIGLSLVIAGMSILRPAQQTVDPASLHMVVHDMRSPLQVLLANLELLKSEIKVDGAHEIQEAINGANRLHQMTTSLLDIGRLEAGRMPVRRSLTSLSELAHSVGAAFRVLQPGRDIGVESRADISCQCDPNLTLRIIENLVGNALKHTPVDGPVRIVVSSSDDRAFVGVYDQGPGVPLSERAQIFEPFRGLNAQSTNGESSGLGLSFCKLAAEAQGGAIRVEDGNPRGSLFVLELPLKV